MTERYWSQENQAGMLLRFAPKPEKIKKDIWIIGPAETAAVIFWNMHPTIDPIVKASKLAKTANTTKILKEN